MSKNKMVVVGERLSLILPDGTLLDYEGDTHCLWVYPNGQQDEDAYRLNLGCRLVDVHGC